MFNNIVFCAIIAYIHMHFEAEHRDSVPLLIVLVASVVSSHANPPNIVVDRNRSDANTG